MRGCHQWNRLDLATASRKQLIAHIDELEYLLSQLLPVNGDVVRFAAALTIPPQHAVVLAALADGNAWTVEGLRAALRSYNRDALGRHIPQIVRNVRLNLVRHGVKIEAIRGLGWRIRRLDLPALAELRPPDSVPTFAVRGAL